MARLLKKPSSEQSTSTRSTGGATSMSPASEKQPRFAQMRQVYTLARAEDPYIGWWMALCVVGVVVVGAIIGGLFGHPIYGGVVALPLGALAATYLLSRRAEKAAYGSIEGRPGAGGAVLQSLRRGWSYEQEPVAVDGGRSTNLEHAALVYRAVGRPGVVLIGEGPTGRTNKLIESERKKVQRLVPNVPVTTYRLGTGEGENVVSVREVTARMRKLKNELTPQEVTAVDRRLKALGRMAPPVPKGVDPQRVRGRGPRM